MKEEKKAQEQPKIRKCYVLREHQLELSELREGDIFRVEGTSRFYVATKNPIAEGQPGNYVVDAEEIAFARCFSADNVLAALAKAVQAPAAAQPKKVLQLKGKKK